MGQGSGVKKKLKLKSIFKQGLKNFTLLKCACHMLLPLSQSSLATFSRRKETRLGEKFQMRKLELGFRLSNHSRPKTKQASCWFF